MQLLHAHVEQEAAAGTTVALLLGARRSATAQKQTLQYKNDWCELVQYWLWARIVLESTSLVHKRLVCNYGKASLLRVPAPTGTRSYGKTAVPVVYSTASILYVQYVVCLLYTSPSPRDYAASRMPSSA